VLFIKEGRLVREKRLSGVAPGLTTGVRLRTGDNARAAELLRETGFAQEVKETAAYLECIVAAAELARIPTLLVGEDIELYEFTPTRESLESVYISEYAEDKKRMIE
jgi:hypothetical protein